MQVAIMKIKKMRRNSGRYSGKNKAFIHPFERTVATVLTA
jgi:hypothetical protein